MTKKNNTHGGGSQTNANGLAYELETSLDEFLKSEGYSIVDNEIFDTEAVKIGLSVQKYKLYSEFLKPNGINYIDYISKRLLPDDAFVNFLNKTIYIIEKKYQKQAGSVDEKLATCDFKVKEYKKLFKPLGYKVKYIYVLSNFFDNPKYDDVLDYIQSMNCDYLFNELTLDIIGLGDN